MKKTKKNLAFGVFWDRSRDHFRQFLGCGLSGLAEDVEQAVPKGVVRQLKAASSEAAPMSLSRILEEYYAYKAEESDNGLRTRMDRIRKDLILSLGKNRFEWTELKDLTRADANAYRDLLLSRMAPNSVQRNLGVVKAAVNHVLLEHDLDIRNVFQAIKIKGAGSSNTDRLPITDEQLALMTPAFASSDVANMRWPLTRPERHAGQGGAGIRCPTVTQHQKVQ
ncbi:hypothetical protein [Yoonia sp.]|uniref:hypothetical protein n=1 Tax=Yoonia sp. TaxID=2212373 RepID=UPI002E013261|nr:hypothetical protein [Yoonia sp.]